MTDIRHITDSQLQAAVTDELAWQPNLDSARIGVSVDHGAVTLTGDVDTYPQRRWAEEAVTRVHGVTAIAEEIVVRAAGPGSTDSDIAREAGEALERAVDLPDGGVTVLVHDHVVTLAGHVGWHYEREAAERAVRYLRGVVDVRNQVVVRPLVSAVGVKAAIGAALVRGAQTEGKNITVAADEHGVVTLTGTVHSWPERQAAQIACWSAPGVSRVANELVISG